MHLAPNNERQRHAVVDEHEERCPLSRYQIIQRPRKRKRKIQRIVEKERETGREKGGEIHEKRKAGGVQTASQIGFIVRLMKAITRGRVVPRARGIARRKGLVASRVAHPRVHTGRNGGQSRGRITLRIDHPRLPINGTARYAVRPYVARVMTRSRCAATQTRASARDETAELKAYRVEHVQRFCRVLWIFI